MPPPSLTAKAEILICNDSAAIRSAVQNSPAYVFTRLRIEEDAARDPVDTLRNAELLCSTLGQVHDILTSPDVHFILGTRLQQDLASRDIKQRYLEAQILRAYNEARVCETLGQARKKKLSPYMP